MAPKTRGTAGYYLRRVDRRRAVYTRRSLSDLDCSYTILKKVRDGRYNPIF